MVPVVLAAVAAVALAAHPALSAEVTRFDVPRGSHPHDVAPAPDGNVWYTAQFQGALGILNPNSGQAMQISLGHFAASVHAARRTHSPIGTISADSSANGMNSRGDISPRCG